VEQHQNLSSKELCVLATIFIELNVRREERVLEMCGGDGETVRGSLIVFNT
jgi:hypothetical protein